MKSPHFLIAYSLMCYFWSDIVSQREWMDYKQIYCGRSPGMIVKLPVSDTNGISTPYLHVALFEQFVWAVTMPKVITRT